MTDDRLIQGMAGGGDFRILAAQTTNTVETAREILDLSPVAADALGRALTGSLLLARLLDKDVRNQYVTLRFEGNGPLGAVIAVSKFCLLAVRTGRSEFGSDPASTRHAETPVAPFQLTQTVIRLPLPCAARSGGMAGRPNQGNRQAR